MHRKTPEQTLPDFGSTPLAARQTSRVLGLRETLASCAQIFPSPERRPRRHVVLNSHLSPRKRPGEFLPKSTAARLSNLMRISSLPKSLLGVLRVLSGPRTFRMSGTRLWTGTRMIVTSIPKEMNSRIRNRITLQRQLDNALFLMMRQWFSTLRSLRWHRNLRKLSQYKMTPC